MPPRPSTRRSFRTYMSQTWYWLEEVGHVMWFIFVLWSSIGLAMWIFYHLTGG